jgi:hypothetical protein
MTSRRRDHILGPFVQGMDNRRPATRLEGTKDELGDRLRLAVNTDITVPGTVKRRAGYVRVLAGSDCHSFWTDPADPLNAAEALMAEGTNLLRITGLPDNPTKHVLRNDLVPGRPVSFARTALGVVYSDGARIGRIVAGGERDICPPRPNRPNVAASAGPQSARFGVCATYVSADGGESPATQPVWFMATPNTEFTLSGFRPTFPAGVVGMRLYLTAMNDRALQRWKTYIDASASITAWATTAAGARCPTLHLEPMPPGHIVRYHGSRLLVASGAVLHYSEAYTLGLRNPTKGFIQFPGEITVVESTHGGLWVCADQTYWLPGLDISAASLEEALPYGGVLGSSGRVPNSNDVYWMSPRGLIRATAEGEAQNLQEAKVATGPAGYAAGMFREVDGLKQFVHATFAPDPNHMAATSYMEAEIVRRNTQEPHLMNEHASAGFEYLVEVIRDGVVIESEVVHNLLPVEGINYLLSAGLKGGSQIPTWYIGLFEGNYAPVSGDTAATFPGLATECTTYAEAARVEWNEGSVVSGTVNNSANRAEFTSNALRTIYGGFIASAPAKGATSGTLLSVVRFSSPKTFEPDSVLRVTAGFTMTSV